MQLMDTFRVIYHEEDGKWWAESPDVAGWYAAGGSFAETRLLAEEGIPWALEREDVLLEHFVPAPAPAPA
jgi:predicted RNase H-like HicB family nuclease